jgi:hypothetical protein
MTKEYSQDAFGADGSDGSAFDYSKFAGGQQAGGSTGSSETFDWHKFLKPSQDAEGDE